MTSIPTRNLGSSDLRVSSVGIGCNAFGQRVDADGVRAIVDTAIETGVTFFDTADTYSFGASEQLLGEALAGRRDQVVVATKFGMDMRGANGPDHGRRGSKAYVRQAAEASLRRLGTDYLDLYQLHIPDPNTPLLETIEAMSDLVRDGLVRQIGCSNFPAWQIADSHWLATSNDQIPFVSAQNEYSLYNRSAEVDLTAACEHYGLGLLPYFPLAYGLLTGKYQQGQAAPEGTRLAQQTGRLESADWARIDALSAYADARGVSLLSVAIGGLAAQPGVASVISGVSRAEQVRANAEAAQWIPTREDLDALDAAVPRGSGGGHRIQLRG